MPEFCREFCGYTWHSCSLHNTAARLTVVQHTHQRQVACLRVTSRTAQPWHRRMTDGQQWIAPHSMRGSVHAVAGQPFSQLRMSGAVASRNMHTISSEDNLS